MENIEKAIKRMQKVESACDELIAMASSDIAVLQERKERAAQLIEGFKALPSVKYVKYRQLLEKTAEEISTADLAPVACMNFSIEV